MDVGPEFLAVRKPFFSVPTDKERGSSFVMKMLSGDGEGRAMCEWGEEGLCQETKQI